MRAILSVAIAALHFGAFAAPPVVSSEGAWAKGRILVMPKPGATNAQIIAATGGRKATKISRSGVHLVELPANASETATLARLAHNPHLEFAELDQQVPPSFVPNDPRYSSAWHLTKIGASTAWNTTQGAGVVIAILDSGADLTHPDLIARLVPGWNFYDNNANVADANANGHGTGVAGAAAASTNNGIGVASVAGQAKIMPIRITDPSGVGYFSTMVQGLEYASTRGVRVANISYMGMLSQSVVSAAASAKARGMLTVIAAGNNGKTETFTPSTAYIAVSATNRSDGQPSWSSRGPYISISAPGLDIWSTTKGGGYNIWYGTSVSAPVVAGTLALMFSANPNLTAAQAEAALFASATDLGTVGRDSVYGYGRVNAKAAVLAALAALPPPIDTAPPTVAIIGPVGESTVLSAITISGTASDNVSVAKVELHVNGLLAGTDTTAPYSFSWDSRDVANGTATIQLRAYDAAGNFANAQISVYTNNYECR
jgi:thermitase